MSLPGTNFSRSTTFELSTSSAFSSSAVKVRNWPRLYSYPLTTSRLSISSPVPGSCGRSVIRVAAGLWSSPQGSPLSARSGPVSMAQNPAALHPDPASRPRPHRPALVATPGASEWVSCVSSPATNKSGKTPEKGAGNLANSPAALPSLHRDPSVQRLLRAAHSTEGCFCRCRRRAPRRARSGRASPRQNSGRRTAPTAADRRGQPSHHRQRRMPGDVERRARLPRIGALGFRRILDPARRVHRAGAHQHIDLAQRRLDRRDHLEPPALRPGHSRRRS